MQQKFREKRVIEGEKMEKEVTALRDQNRFLGEFLEKYKKEEVVEEVAEEGEED